MMSAPPVRPLILGTGSRFLVEEQMVYDILEQLTNELNPVGHNPVILMHGANRHGADHYIDLWGNRQSRGRIARIERFPAAWHKLGDAAGPARNGDMVERAWIQQHAGSRVVVAAFPEQSSVGTADLLRQARKAGIRDIRVYRKTEAEPACDTSTS
jgi:hypothetical protein